MARIYHIDAFCEGPGSGNPAGVCLLAAGASEKWMADLAAELQFSETAFVRRQGRDFELRWFTPAGVEVDLCGHATLAAARALLEEGWARPEEALRFWTRSGELRAWRRRDNGWIELDFPEQAARQAEAPAALLAALGLSRPQAQARAGEDWLLQVGSESLLRELRPNWEALASLGGRGVCVTSRAEVEGADFVSRFFAPALGIPEDPVTGSAHCYLGPWWAGQLGRRELIGRQLSARGGLVRVRLQGGRAFLSGETAVQFKGEVA